MSKNLGWIELVFTAVVALGFGIWQYWSVSREIRLDKEKSGSGAGHTVREHELDDR